MIGRWGRLRIQAWRVERVEDTKLGVWRGRRNRLEMSGKGKK